MIWSKINNDRVKISYICVFCVVEIDICIYDIICVKIYMNKYI